MKYQVIVLDLDGTLTNSKKEITAPTRDALIEIQQNGKDSCSCQRSPDQRCRTSGRGIISKRIRWIYAFL